MAARLSGVKPVVVRINPRKVRGMTVAVLVNNMHVCGVFLVDRVKVKLNKTQRVRILKSGHIIGLSPSRPGEPPRKITGQLQNSIRYRVQSGFSAPALFIGSSLKKALWLEIGTRKMRPRPYLRRTILENRRKIGRIIVHGRRGI